MGLPNKSGIYCITNNETQKRYIGYASKINTRINGHKHDLRNNKHGNDYLQKAWNKYGPNTFEFKVLELCNKEDLPLREDYWVKVLNTCDREFGYNLKPTDPNISHRPHSFETIAKLKITNNKPWPEAARIARNLIPMSEEHKKLLARKRKEANLIMLEKGLTIKERQRIARGKRIENIITGKVYRSLADLIEEENLVKTTISHKLAGSRNNNTPYRYL